MREDWIKCKIGDITVKSNKTSREKENSEDFFEYIDISTVDNTAFKLKETKLLSWNDAPSRAQQIVDTNDVLFSTVRPYLKNIAFVPNDSNNRRIASTGFCILKPFKIILPKFLFYFVCYDKTINEISKYQTGTSYPAVRDSDIFSIDFPLPPFPEQQAIVKKLESLLSSLDAGVADFKKAQQQLKIYRQAVLKKAFETDEYQKLECVIESSQNGLSKRNSNSGTDFKVLRLADIHKQRISYSSPRTIKLVENEIKKYLLTNNDLLIIRVNGSIDLVGRFIHINDKDQVAGWTFCDHFIQLKISDKYDAKYLFFYSQLIAVRNYINENMVSSAGQNTVNRNTIKNLLVPVVDIIDQRKTIKEIESRLSVCDSVEVSIKESLIKSEALRQSILKKAFEGKLLTAQELAECKKAPDYEPASLLLERIIAEQKVAKPEKKPGYRKEKVSL